ncbi:CHASE2 domain-containing protein [Leptothoe sp. PORK10 BA2]|uniref:CHASE2 domain-containing protein n=1 Tax=Leptothoe sp. PORK10 BA2 TaxID=3110254 RepID=UPI002B1F348B|nr:CHASE2 domain-containing protein [Leptothoe sp. PORK10 BA2]MEA5462939.1 CHASE2 domain-containing protein [Leptothoe sp. PORK10 BA2]
MKHWVSTSGWRLLPGLLAAGLTLMAARVGLVQPLEHKIYRSLFQIRGEQPWDDRVVLIEIDASSLAEMGQFPWPRHYYTELLDQITPANPSVIAFDILFAEPSEDDAALVKAMARHGDVVVATAWDAQRGVIGPNAKLVEGAIATGHIHSLDDTDSISRTYRPKVNGTPALSLSAVQRYKLKQSDSWAMPNLNHPLWLNWPGFVENAPHYSFVDVLTGQVPATTFTNKIVFIGFTGVGLDDIATPYDQTATGVYQHMAAANNLLTQNYLRPVDWPIWMMVALLSPATSYWMFYRCLRVQLLASLTLTGVWSSLVVVAFGYSYWLPTIVPLVSISLTSLFVRSFEHFEDTQLLQWHGKPEKGSIQLPAIQPWSPVSEQ